MKNSISILNFYYDFGLNAVFYKSSQQEHIMAKLSEKHEKKNTKNYSKVIVVIYDSLRKRLYMGENGDLILIILNTKSIWVWLNSGWNVNCIFHYFSTLFEKYVIFYALYRLLLMYLLPQGEDRDARDSSFLLKWLIR